MTVDQVFIIKKLQNLDETILEALNTDLVCDAINTAMRELFLQIVYESRRACLQEGKQADNSNNES